MLELGPRVDLAALDDVALADRLDKCFQASESARKRFGWLYNFYKLSWMPRMAVKDPRDYWYPSHINSEIRDIMTEFQARGHEPRASRT